MSKKLLTTLSVVAEMTRAADCSAAVHRDAAQGEKSRTLSEYTRWLPFTGCLREGSSAPPHAAEGPENGHIRAVSAGSVVKSRVELNTVWHEILQIFRARAGQLSPIPIGEAAGLLLPAMSRTLAAA